MGFRGLKLLHLERHRDAVVIKLHKESVLLLEAEVSALEFRAEHDGDDADSGILNDFKRDDLSGVLDLTVYELPRNLIFISGKTSTIALGILRREHRSIEGARRLVEEPISATEDEDEYECSDEETLRVNA